MIPTPKRERPNNEQVQVEEEQQVRQKPRIDTSGGEQPNQTIYLNNLPDRLKKPFLRHQLYILGSAYGQVLDVIALKTPKMRGQAHLVFKQVEHAMVARRELDGFPFFGKVIRARFAKGTSRKAQEFNEMLQAQKAQRKHSKFNINKSKLL